MPSPARGEGTLWREPSQRQNCSRESTMMRTINFTLNGETVSAHVAEHQSIVEVLRDHFELFGARESCAQGLCGCCTVVVDGTAVSGCLYLAQLADGASVQTVEEGAELDAVQQAFVESSAFQCGFCTPGFVLMTRQLLDEHRDPDDDTIKHYLSGNLCRCAAYPEIIEAVKLAARKRRKE
jgi:aerobic carbon-monoxide dehydrogenase small subunit